MKYHYIAHTSLDVIEEKGELKKKEKNRFFLSNDKIKIITKKQKVNTKNNTKKNNENYLGLLFPTEDYNVYGYITNTQIKFVLVVDDNNDSKSIKNMFVQLHNHYVDMVMNPFYKTGGKITSQIFKEKVFNLIKSGKK